MPFPRLSLRSDRPMQQLPEPTSTAELKALIIAQDPMPRCNCDLCDAAFYKSAWNYIHPHHHIKLELDDVPNKYGKPCYRPFKLPGVIVGAECMQLARQTIAYFDKPVDELNDVQHNALEKFKEWRDRRVGDIFRNHPNSNFDTLVPAPEMRQLLTWFNELFFVRDTSRLSLHWAADMPGDGASGRGRMLRHEIWMRTSMIDVSTEREHIWMIDLLSNLLHEAVHVYLAMRGCEKCHSARWNIMRNGHGRAWQMLAGRVEDCFARWTGVPLRLTRFESILVYWEAFSALPLPSLHDLEDWGLDGEERRWEYTKEVVYLFDWCKKQGIADSDIWGVVRKWRHGDLGDKPWEEEERVLEESMIRKRKGSMVCGGLEDEVEDEIERDGEMQDMVKTARDE